MENIAVIGIANLFPGSKTPEEFWQQLLAQQDCRSKATNEQMGVDPLAYFGGKGETDKFYCIHGGYIRGFDFKPGDVNSTHSGLTDSYLTQLDDLHKWSLYVMAQALKDAGYWQNVSLDNCGLILGNLSFPTKTSNHLFLPLYHQVVNDTLKQHFNEDFELSHFSEQVPQVHANNALVAGYPAALLAQAAGLGGPHFALDAACASSCYSVKLACDYLHTGKADMMLAGAVSGADPLFVNMGFSIFQAYPANNVHAPFDANSQGLFAGEGSGMMVLKRHSDAVRDGDKIHAIIKGGALSNDGKGEFVLSPNTKGQVLVYERAYKNAGIDPNNVDYIECHATGTPKGDKVELGSMDTFFSSFNQSVAKKPLLGSVKSNLGHLLTAAGMPGMTKAIWALNESKIPATINLTRPLSSRNNYFDGANIPVTTTDWPKHSGLRTAGVSVFGFGGANAHLILQQATTALENKIAKVKPRESLAIIGMDAHFGRAKNLAEFQQVIETNRTTFIELPEKRWKGIEKNPAVMSALALSKPPIGSYVESFDIDFLRFKVPPNEGDCLIAQQLMMMKVADNAARDAKLRAGTNVAVLVAMGVELELHQYRGRVNLTTQIQESLSQQGIELSEKQSLELQNIVKDGVAQAAQLNQYTSFIGNIMASRISALWDFSGPAFTVSAEENSVYRCIELAENLFQTSDVEAVIIASVDLAGSVENITLRQHYGPVSKTAESSKQGWQVGEGAGAFVVLPESKASKNSYASINALSFVNGTDDKAIIKAANKAFNIADISASDIEHVEAHNSGFIAENDAEESAFSQLYLAQVQNKAVSSVKGLVGHTFNASGMASIIKTALLLNSAKDGTLHAVNGLGKDDSCAHLILAANQLQHPILNAPLRNNKPQLIKTITLGGDNIASKIACSLDATGLKQVQLKNKPSNVKQAVNLMNIIPKVSEQTQVKSELSEVRVNKIEQKTSVNTTKQRDLDFGINVTNKPNITHTSISTEIKQQTATHQAFLVSRQIAGQQIAKLVKLQSDILSTATESKNHIKSSKSNSVDHKNVVPLKSASQNIAAKTTSKNVTDRINYPAIKLIERFNKPNNIIWNTADLIEFAEGDIGKVFGAEYDIIDTYPRRVRLPTTDYLLVSRVTALEAQVHEYKKSYMCTEYDIPVDAPFLIDGQIPWSVSVESGQCDLLLISYIGIDFQAKGERVYRLLDCELTFLEDMAFGGETLRYEIHIDSYAKNGDQLLFFFHYDCYVGDKKVLIMRNGCAGFFTDEELAEGKGVILNDKDKAQLEGAKKSRFEPLIYSSGSHYDYEDMIKLVNGDIAGCFGKNYDQAGRNPSLKFSSEKFLMIERVTKIVANGGHWGLGLLEGQKDLKPEHWYFPCHFKDDQVMAGSLMSEGCGQMAMFFMLKLGMHKHVNNARFQPMPGESQTVRCRGQVTPQVNTLTYRMEVTQMGMSPYPFMKANIDIILDGKVVVDFKNLSMMIKEQDEYSPYPVTLPAHIKLENSNSEIDANQLDERGIAPFKDKKRPLMRVESDFTADKNKGVTPIKHFMAPEVEGQNRVPDTVPFTPWHLFEFATGNISNCFGSDFDIYTGEKGRIPPRTPCGDLQVVTQVVAVTGKRLDFKNPATCTAEYYVPEDAWYFTKNSHDNWIPYSLIMEIALQPNGFISGYMGTTLKYPDKDLFFRNLDGSGELLKQLDLRGKTIVNKSVLLSTTMAGGMIVQSFTFDLYVKQTADEDIIFYTGTAVFGYFAADALANQLGIDNGKVTHAWFIDNKIPKEKLEIYDLTNESHQFFQAIENKPYYKLAGGQLNFVDTVTIVEGGGSSGFAYIYGERLIDATDWFFRYHFHQDPVMPGSLGVEAIIELLQVYALKNDLGTGFINPRFIAPMTQVKWKYRGQITPLNKQMSLDVHITDIIKKDDEIQLVGDANLSKDGLRIYEVKDIVLSIVEA